MEDLPESEDPTTPPPRPRTLPSTSPPNLISAPTVQSPIGEDPATASFPSSQTTTSLHDFRERYNLVFNEDMDFHDFQRLTQQFTADAVDLARTLSSQQYPTAGCECHDCELLLVRQKKSRWLPELSSQNIMLIYLLEIYSGYTKYIIGIKEIFRTT
jgi:hypothetical protein